MKLGGKKYERKYRYVCYVHVSTHKQYFQRYKIQYL